MSADFTPPLEPYNNTSKFKFWCNKVLPLVYDDSLSYYEVLNKVVDYLNNVIENMDTVEDNVQSVYDAFVELQDYVNEYFDSQDWQSMVNNKIDELIIEGYFETIIEPLVTEDFNIIVAEFNEFKEEVNGNIQSQNDEIDEFKEEVNDDIDDFKHDVNSDLQTQNSNIAVLVARMDTFASLPDGSTAGDAELLDIRVGADGVTYTSAGDAVRAQYTLLNNALLKYNLYNTVDVNVAFPVLINAYSVNSAGRLSSTENSVATYGWGHTPYIYHGSTITAKTGYLYSYALWTVPVYNDTSITNRIAFGRDIAAGVVTNIEQDCYILVSVKKTDESAFDPSLTIEEIFANALMVNVNYDCVKERVEFNKALSDMDIENLNTHIADIADIVPSDNRINLNDIIDGVIGTNGTIEESSSYKSTESYISVIPNTKYTFRRLVYVALYGYDKRFIARQSYTPTITYTVEMPSDVHYIRVSSNVNPVTYPWYLNKGTTLVEESYTQDVVNLKEINVNNILDDDLVSASKAAQAKAVGDALNDIGYCINSAYYKGKLDIFEGDLSEWYDVKQTTIDTSTFGENTTYETVISAFDALALTSNGYMSDKTSLGQASGLDANNNPYYLYEYVLKPKHYESLVNYKKVTKILLQCCEHGFEKGILYGAYYFIKDLIENWDKNQRLNFIRNHVEIHFIPVVNPWGFDNKSYCNGNGVNILRNYDVPNWQYYPPTDTTNSSGDEPFDQPESQIVKAWCENNTDALLYVSGHTNGRYYSSGYNEINPCMPVNDIGDAYYNKCFSAFVRHIEDQTKMFSKLYPSITPDTTGVNSFCGKLQTLSIENVGGSFAVWASYEEKFVAFTLEGINGLSVNNVHIIEYMSADAFKIDAEIIGNTLAEMLREYAPN